MATTEKKLTAKQEQVRDLLEAGKTVHQIARTLKTKPNSVYNHIRHIRAAGYDVSTNSGRQNGSAPAPAIPNTRKGPIGAILDDAEKALTEALDDATAAAQVVMEESRGLDAQIDALQLRRKALGEQADQASAQIDRLRAASADLKE